MPLNFEGLAFILSCGPWGVPGLCAEPDMPDIIRLILGNIRLRSGKIFAPGGARQPWWRDIRLRLGKFRLRIWLHTGLGSIIMYCILEPLELLHI